MGQKNVGCIVYERFFFCVQGLAFLPKNVVDVKNMEFARACLYSSIILTLVLFVNSKLPNQTKLSFCFIKRLEYNYAYIKGRGWS